MRDVSIAMLAASDLRDFCRDDEVFRFFADFARAGHFEEALLFVRAVVAFREAGPELQRQAATVVATTFLTRGGEKECNLDEEVAGPVRQAVAEGRVTNTLFDEAEATVLVQLQQSYALFGGSAQHASMTAERDRMRARMFGADEIAATMREEEPVQQLVFHPAHKVRQKRTREEKRREEQRGGESEKSREEKRREEEERKKRREEE